MVELEDELREEIDTALAKVFLTLCLLGFFSGVLAGLGAAVLIAVNIK